MNRFEIDIPDLKAALRENFDDKAYRKEEVEEIMGVTFLGLLKDLNYGQRYINSIYTVNVYR